MDSSQFPKGTILNFYGEKPKNLISRIVYWEIRRYQKRKYPHSPRTDAIHSMIHVGGGDYLSVQSPRAVIVQPQLDPGERCSFWQYKYLDRFDVSAWAAFDQAVKDIVGTPYDYGQLLDILVHQLFGWLPEKLSLFDFSRKRKVCSVAAHAVLLAAWKQIQTPIPGPFPTGCGEREKAPRPLGDQYVEHTCPADFENHETFELAHEYVPPLGGGTTGGKSSNVQCTDNFTSSGAVC